MNGTLHPLRDQRTPGLARCRLSTRLIPKLRGGNNLEITVNLHVTLSAGQAEAIKGELLQVLDDLGLTGQIAMYED